MSTAIWKFPFYGGPGDSITLSMPAGARLLDVQLQGDMPTLWALVDKGAAVEPRRFTVLGTGWDLPDEYSGRMRHLATLQQNGFVWHVFEIAEPEAR